MRWKRQSRVRGSGELLAQVVLVDQQGPLVTLDCVTAADARNPDGTVVEAGTPFALTGTLPESAWAVDATNTALAKWSTEASLVRVAIVAGGEGKAIAIHDSDTRIRLPIAVSNR